MRPLSTTSAIVRTLIFFFIIGLGNSLSAQRDFLFIVDNSGSISNAEFDAFANIIMETANQIDGNCPNSTFAIVHYGGNFGMETTINTDFVPLSTVVPISRVYHPCVEDPPGSGNPVASPIGACGDDLPNAFDEISTFLTNGSLNTTPGSNLAVVIFTDADGLGLGGFNQSPCNLSGCSTLLPMDNFNTFMNTYPFASSYVVGVEDTDSEGVLANYIYGDGNYTPIAFTDPPIIAAQNVASSITCENIEFPDCVPFTIDLSSEAIPGFNCFHLLTGTNNVILAVNAVDGTFTAPALGQHYGYLWCTDDATVPMVGQDATTMTASGLFNLSPPLIIDIVDCPILGLAKDLVNVTDNMNGTYKVNYIFTIENMSTLAYSGLEIFDDIANTFSGFSPTNYNAISGTLAANPSWDGTFMSNALMAGQTLAGGASGTVNISFDITPDYITTNVDNQASCRALDPNDEIIMDISTDGLIPDTNSNGNSEEMVPTPTPLPSPPGSLGLAKDLVNVTDNMNGTYKVSYLLTLENFSVFPLTALQITDDIVSQFSGFSPTNFTATNGSLNANGGWNGTATSNILVAGQTLAVAATETVSISFDITPDYITTNVDNTALAQGTEPDGDPVTDTSTDGLNPDPGNDGTPEEMVPTPTPLPNPNGSIGLAKNTTSVTNNNNGTYKVSYMLTIENFSPFAISNLTITDNIVAQFSGFSPTNYTATNGSLNANGGWNGTATSNILVAGQTLAVAATETVSISFDITPDYITTNVNNTAIAQGTEPDGDPVTDSSTDGFNPDPGNDGTPEEMVPTPTPLPSPSGSIGLAKNTTSVTNNNNGTYKVSYMLTIENFSPFAISNLTITDNIVAQFSGFSPTNYTATNGSLNANGGWNGTATSNILVAGQTLAVAATETVSISFDITPDYITTNVNNTAIAQGTEPDGDPVTDTSTDGFNPDPGNDGTPEEMVPTPTPLPNPNGSIGLAKDLINVADNMDGTYKVSYLLTVENFSPFVVSNLVLTDDIVNQFTGLSPANYTATNGSLNANGSWSGTAFSNILQNGQSLAINAVETVTISFDITPDYNTTNVNNTAFAEGTEPDGDAVNDTSTDGLNPDPGNDGTPEEMTPTPTPIPNPNGSIGLAKNLIDVTDNGNNTYKVSYLLTVENYSPFAVSNLILTDDIVNQFTGFSPTNYTATNGTLNANNVWNGTASSNILQSGQSLAVNATETVSISFDITPDFTTTNVNNTAFARATEPDGDPVTDTSTDGLDPDPGNDGTPEEMVPTPTPLPELEKFVGIAKNLLSVLPNNNGTYTLSYLFTVENFAPITMHDIVITDDILTQFGGLNPTSFNAVSISLTANPNWNGSAASNILQAGQSIGAGEIKEVRILFTITPNGFTTEVFNFANVCSTPGVGTAPFCDTSTNGKDPDPNGDDNPDEDDPTRTPIPQVGKIGNFVWHDTNGNGIQNFNESGIPNVIVNIHNPADHSILYTTTTNSSGFYLFDQVPVGDYYLSFELASDYLPTTAFAGNNTTTDSNVDGSFGSGTTPIFNLQAAESEFDIDAGFYKCVQIGELVYYDFNTNNRFDSFENGVNGLSIHLYRLENSQWVLKETQITGHKPGTQSDDGYFKFCVIPGTYYLKLELPPVGLVMNVQDAYGYAPLTSPSEDPYDSDLNYSGSSELFTVSSGQTICNIGAGVYPMATVGNIVWMDLNSDGLQSAAEPPISGVTVSAYNIYGEMIAQATTNSNGNYNIDYLGQDDYYLHFNAPPGYTATQSNILNNELNSDINHSNGAMTTSFFNISSGENLTTIDAGMVLGVVPLDWVSIKVSDKDSYHLLEWTTANEENVEDFEIERSFDGQFFEKISSLPANENADEFKDYTYSDKDLATAGNYFYRVKQIDRNGQFEYSEVVSLNRRTTDELSVYPNPAKNSISLEFSGVIETVEIYHADGSLLQTIEILDSDQKLDIDLQHLAQGVYVLKGTLNAQSFTKTFVKI